MPQLTKRSIQRANGILLVKIEDVKNVEGQEKGTPGFAFTCTVVNSPETDFIGNKVFHTFWLPKPEDLENPKYALMVNQFVDFVAAVSGQKANEGDGFNSDDEKFIPSLLEELVTVQVENSPYKDKGTGAMKDSYKIVAAYPASEYDTQVSIYRDQVSRQKANSRERF